MPDRSAAAGSDGKELTEIQIQWIETQKSFHPGKVHAELRRRVGGKTVEMEYVRHKVTPEGMFDVVIWKEECTEKVTVLKATLTEGLLKSEDFFDRIKRTAQVDMTVRPKAAKPGSGDAAPGVEGAGEVTESCLLRVIPPQAKIHWVDERTGARDGVIEVEADGADELPLLVELHRFQPKLGRVDRDDSIHFTHKTESMYPKEIFGPHKDDLPWVVAKKGSGNRRQRSRWDSKMVLPTDRAPDVTVPITGSIRCKAWGPHDIAERVSNEIVAAEDARVLALTQIPVNLIPAVIVAELVEPVDPVPADGQPHEIVLEFRRKKKNTLLERGQVSWELDTAAGQPGGTIDPGVHTLEPADAGRVRARYTPPAMTYEPGGVYRQKLRIFAGAGPKRREMDPVVIDVNPGIDLTIDGEKKGLEFDPPYGFELEPGATPSVLVGHLGWRFRQGELHIEDDLHANDTKPLVTINTMSGEVQANLTERTAATGTFELKLPELEEGLRHMPHSRRTVELRPFEQEPPCNFDQQAKDTIVAYQAYLLQTQTRLIFNRLLTPDLQRGLDLQKHVQAKNVTSQLESELAKILHGTDVLLATSRGTVKVDQLHAKLFDAGLDLLCKFFWDLLDVLIRVKEVGKLIVGAMPAITGRLGAWAVRQFANHLHYLKDVLASPMWRGAFVDLVNQIDDIARALSGAAPQLQTAIIRLWESVTIAIQGCCLKFIMKTEQMFISSLAALAGLNQSADMLARKSTEFAIKNMSKALQGLLSSGANQFSTWHEMKAWARDHLVPLFGVDDVARSVVGTNTAAVAALDYPLDTSRDDTYLLAISELSMEQETMHETIGWVDDILKQASFLCDCLWAALGILGLIASILSWGAFAPAVIAALGVVSTCKLAVNGYVHIVEGMFLVGMACQILARYQGLTLDLTGKAASA